MWKVHITWYSYSNQCTHDQSPFFVSWLDRIVIHTGTLFFKKLKDAMKSWLIAPAFNYPFRKWEIYHRAEVLKTIYDNVIEIIGIKKMRPNEREQKFITKKLWEYPTPVLASGISNVAKSKLYFIIHFNTKLPDLRRCGFKLSVHSVKDTFLKENKIGCV